MSEVVQHQLVALPPVIGIAGSHAFASPVEADGDN